jgi:hypothetical protein
VFGGLSLVSGAAEGHGTQVHEGAGVAALEARQLRLLAYAVGDHLPVELALQVAELEARRRALLAGYGYGSG